MSNDPNASAVEAIDLVELTVEQVQAGFASGAFTCESLTQAFLDRIAVYNAHYNAIVFLNLTTAVLSNRVRFGLESAGCRKARAALPRVPSAAMFILM